MKTKHLLLLIPIILFSSCSSKSNNSLTSLTQEEFRELHGFKPVGVYAGFNAKLSLFYIGNSLLERLIILDKDSKGISTVGYINGTSELNYITAPSDEFQFQIGNVLFSGKNGQLTYLSHEIINLPGGARQLKIALQHKDSEERVLLKVYVNYEIYPNNAIIRKWLEFENLSDSAIVVENLQIERLSWLENAQNELKLYGYSLDQNYAIPFSGGADEPIILGFLNERGEGFILGNEAPGVLKHFDLYTLRNTISIGLPPKEDNWATEIRVPIGETSASPKTFIMLFTGNDLQKALKDGLGRFVNQYFNASAKLRELSQYVYLMDVSSEAKAPKEKPGEEVKLVCINYDWQQSLLEMTDTNEVKDDNSTGDETKPKYSIAKDNFPMLLEFSRSLHDANLKFGIYVDLTTIKMNSPISKHSEWAFKLADGKDWMIEGQEGKGQEVTAEQGEPKNEVVGERSEQAKIFCIASDYGVYAAQAMADLIESLDETVGYQGDRPSVVLDYIILDMPTIGSAEQSIYGCAAYGHGHYSRPDSLWKIYESLFEIADFLHQKFPDLVICISPKTYGTQIPDFALLSHIDQFLVFSGENHPKVSDLTNFLPRNLLLKVWSEF
jgi:alpha-galactosidase